MQLLECTQEYEPKYDLWPYKRRNTEGSITKNYRCVDLTMMHICRKFERNPSRNVACRAHTRFPPKYDLWPYKRPNTGGSITKNNRRVDFTTIHLHTKFERNPSRNAAVRAHTRMWRCCGVTLLNPKYPPAVVHSAYYIKMASLCTWDIITPALAPLQPSVLQEFEGINSCWVPIYYTWVERDTCRQNALSRGIRTGQVQTWLWLWVESTNQYATMLPHRYSICS